MMLGSPRLQPISPELNPAAPASLSLPNLILRTLAATLAMSSSVTASYAACGMASLGGGDGGPPSISATESSTTQVLEEIRRRTQAAEQQAQPIPASYTTTAPAAEAQASSSSSSAPPKAAEGAASAQAKKPKYKQVASTEQPAAAPNYLYPEVMGGTERILSSWGQGFVDWENHSNIAPGTEENRSRTSKTAGVVSGSDLTWVNPAARQAVQIGYFTGYSATFNSFGDTNFNASASGSNDNINRTDSKQKIDGSFLGAYLAAVRGNATFDLAFKADLFDLHQSSLLTQTEDSSTCGAGPQPSVVESGSASVNNYTIAADASYRYDVSRSAWYEPIFSIRYTITQYGNDPTHFTNVGPTGLPALNINDSGRLGLEDGTVLRLQGGLRRGEQGVLPDGGLWTVVGGAYLYSDVMISGFKFNPGVAADGTPLGTTVFPVDEGKIRGLGQILTTFDYSNGWSYLMMGEVRGGEDLIGVDGRVGARYRW